MANRDVNNKIFDQSVKVLARNFGDGFLTFGQVDAVSRAIPTGHDDLDDILTKGARGIFLGGIIEFCGSEGSGKTQLALRVVGNAQKEGHRCCWFDAEASFEPSFAVLNGCDPQTLLLPDMSSASTADGINFFNSAEVLEMVYKAVVSNVFGLVVLDSVAGLMPARVLEDTFDPNSSGISELARNIAAILPKIVQACHKTQTSVIFINQLRDQPGAYVQNRFHTPGGRALKFFAHQRISIEKINGQAGQVISSTPDGVDEIIGHYAKARIIKNRKAPPALDSIEIPIYYRQYFPDDAKKSYDLARRLQVITIRNEVLTWKDNNDSIVLQQTGESSMLSAIRSGKLETKLISACIAAAADEKNQKRKPPITVPSSLLNLVKTESDAKSTENEDKVSAKKRRGPALAV